MSALKDLLVSSGGLLLTRDRGSYQKASMQAFIDGVQLPGVAMELLVTSLDDIFASESTMANRVGQVNYLWHRLSDGVPLVKPAGGHAVFLDVRAFLPHLSPEQFPAEALAAFIYHMSGVRLTKGPPAAPSQARPERNRPVPGEERVRSEHSGPMAAATQTGSTGVAAGPH